MAGQMTVMLRADPNQFESGIRAAQQAVDRFLQASEDGASDTDEAFAEVIRTMVELGRASGRSTDEIRDDLGKLGLSAKDAEDAIRQIGDEAGDSADRTRRIGDSARDSGEGFRDLGDIARDALSGDIASAVDGVVNLIGGIGVAGGIAAGGLAVVTSALQAQQEEADKLAERLSNAYRGAIEEGRDYVNEAQVIAEIQDLMFNTDRAGEYNRLLEDQKKLGLDIETLAGANIGRQEDLAAVQERINVMKEQGSEIDRGSDAILGNIDTQLGGIENRWRRIQEETSNQQRKVAELEAAESRLGDAARQQINRTADTAAARYTGIAQQYGVPIQGRVVLNVDDSQVRNYRPPSIRGTVRLSPRLDQAV